MLHKLCYNETKKEFSTHRIQDFSKWGLCYIMSLLSLCARLFMCALWSPAGKGLTSWVSFVVSNCEFVTFPLIGILGQVWYLIVSIPDLCTLTYFYMEFRFAALYHISLKYHNVIIWSQGALSPLWIRHWYRNRSFRNKNYKLENRRLGPILKNFFHAKLNWTWNFICS